MRNNRNVFLMLAIVSVIVLVSAEPVWNPSAYDDVYYFSEDSISSYNFTANLSDASNLSHFLILDIFWIDGLLGPDHSDFYWLPWNDSEFSNSTSGVLNLSATLDNETGNFTLNVFAQGEQTGSSAKFRFIINATNDAPDFVNLGSDYNFSQDDQGLYTINAVDEEAHYPLDFNLTFLNNCTHASWSGRNTGENCSIFNLTYGSDSSTVFDFTPGYNDVGTYWANLTVTDFNGTCPHAYCDSSKYEVNKTSGVYLVEFNVYSSLSLNVSNCSGVSMMEGDSLNCTIEITTHGEEDELNFSSYGFFSSNHAMPYDSNNRDWFYGASSDNATNFSYSLPISVTPDKNEVGNWTINFTVVDVLTGSSKVEQIEIFVNYTESSVSLDPVSDMEIYENSSFELDAYDEDLRIWDTSIKDEVLTFASNTSWVVPGVGSIASGNNYSESTIFIDYDYVLNNFGVGNYSVMINVTDVALNFDSSVFVVEILSDLAPEWNTSLSNPVVFNLTEGIAFFYNVSTQVNDSENDSITFYYENVSEEFCSLTESNFIKSTGIISFVPVDCDVGFHNVSIIASDGKLNSSWSFIFNVSNVEDVPSIFLIEGDNSTGYSLTEGFDFMVTEGDVINFSLIVNDDDFLIPVGQKSYYNESIIVNITFTNSTGGLVDLFNFSFVEFENPAPESVSYNATFTPGVEDVGDYVVFVNISDYFGNVTNRTWNFNISAFLQSPVLEQVDNVSLTVYENLNFSLNATDNEDDYNGLNLSYSVMALDSGAPNLSVSENIVEFNMSSNQSLAGIWRYNISVVDNDSMEDWQVFYLFVYGNASLVSPVENFSFNLVENVSSVLNFTINHSVGDNLTYEFWIDNVSCSFQNNSNCSYGNLSFREVDSGVGNGSVFGWEFSPSFTDETYGLEKNLTVMVYPNTSLLSFNQSHLVAMNFSFRLNITHANAPMRAVAPIGLLQGNYGSNIEVDLSSYFTDEDVDDSYWNQNITFSKSAGNANIFVGYVGGWNVQIFTNIKSAFTGFIDILGDDNFTSDTISDVEVKFTAPTQRTSSSSSTRTVVKFYSIRIIVPDDVIISDENYIDVPFALENSGTIDLEGIDLSSTVLYNNKFSDDVKINLGENHIDSLKAGERKDYSMRILANTDKAGRYKATLFANVSSPHFSDWGDFFIDLRKTNESEAEELLIFTEKIISDNPECLELTEVFRRAQEYFEAGNEVEAIKLAKEVSAACEDAISANEQVKYKIEGFVEKNFYYISFITLFIFFVGFIFYVYKRVRFNKSVEDDYVR